MTFVVFYATRDVGAADGAVAATTAVTGHRTGLGQRSVRRLNAWRDGSHVNGTGSGVRASAPAVLPAALQQIHFVSYVAWDNNQSDLHYWRGNKFDAWMLASVPPSHRSEGVRAGCIGGSMVARGAVCDWEMFGCSQPNYPPYAATLAGFAYQLIGANLMLSFETLPVRQLESNRMTRGFTPYLHTVPSHRTFTPKLRTSYTPYSHRAHHSRRSFTPQLGPCATQAWILINTLLLVGLSICCLHCSRHASHALKRLASRHASHPQAMRMGTQLTLRAPSASPHSRSSGVCTAGGSGSDPASRDPLSDPSSPADRDGGYGALQLRTALIPQVMRSPCRREGDGAVWAVLGAGPIT